MLLARDWVDYASLGIAAAAAAGTFAAVLVALFGERLRDRRRRPLLTLTNSDPLDFEFAPGDDQDADAGLYVVIANAPGRDTARDVEIYVSLTNLDADSRNLNVGGVMDGTGGSATMQLPAGHRRRVYVCNVGTPEALLNGRVRSDIEAPGLDASLRPVANMFHAALSVWPPRPNFMYWIADGKSTKVELTVTGANVVTTRYRGAFVVTTELLADDTRPGLDRWLASARWTVPPQPVS